MCTRVKICGNRTFDEVSISINYGADAIGLIVNARHKTEDNLSVNQAKNIVNQIPPFINSVLVSHDLKAEDIISTYSEVLTTTIQLQDDIKTNEIESIRSQLRHVKLIKAIHIIDHTSIDEAMYYSDYVDALLLDTITNDRIGGTGVTHDWKVSRKIVEIINKPVILAGGLNPDNIRDAIKAVKPFAVDVNSGVEFPDGSKDPDKIRRFIEDSRKCF